jgi:predicted ATPase
VGKTTLLRELARLGYPVVEESAREIIRERKTAGLPPRPDAVGFAREILLRDERKYDAAAKAPGWIFFDRSAVEAAGMLFNLGAISQPELDARLARLTFHPVVFVLPPWPDIFTRDEERDHSLAHCVRVHDEVIRWYTRCGYTVREVPVGDPKQRADHVLQVLGSSGAQALPNTGSRLPFP